MHVFGKIIKYILWALFIFILAMLGIGIVKNDFNVGNYFKFLNGRDWNIVWQQASISNINSIANIFFDTALTGQAAIDSGSILTGEGMILSGENISGEVDIYDEAFEQNMNDLTSGNTANTTGEDFGFLPNGNGGDSDNADTGDDKAAILELLKKSKNIEK